MLIGIYVRHTAVNFEIVVLPAGSELPTTSILAIKDVAVWLQLLSRFILLQLECAVGEERRREPSHTERENLFSVT